MIAIMTRELASTYVAYVVDDAGAGRELHTDPQAEIRPGNRSRLLTDERTTPESMCYRSVLVGWQCGFEPLFVAVHSCLDVQLTEQEAEEMAAEYLEEIGWFAAGPYDADYVIR